MYFSRLLIVHGDLFLSGVELHVDLRTDTKKIVVCFDRDWSTCLEISNFFSVFVSNEITRTYVVI